MTTLDTLRLLARGDGLTVPKMRKHPDLIERLGASNAEDAVERLAKLAERLGESEDYAKAARSALRIGVEGKTLEVRRDHLSRANMGVRTTVIQRELEGFEELANMIDGASASATIQDIGTNRAQREKKLGDLEAEFGLDDGLPSSPPAQDDTTQVDKDAISAVVDVLVEQMKAQNERLDLVMSALDRIVTQLEKGKRRVL